MQVNGLTTDSVIAIGFFALVRSFQSMKITIIIDLENFLLQ